jgi:transposase
MDPEGFDRAVEEICTLYRSAGELHHQGVHLVSTDEKTGIQALEHLHPSRGMRPGEVEKIEWEYVRHGTQCLMANLEVATGQILAPSVGATRTEADFAAHIEQTIQTDVQAGWIFVVDQLDTHKSESLVRLLARHLHLELDLGEKGKSGILKTRFTRADFLMDPTHRIRFVYTPKHTSWMNQVEIWFSILVRRLLKRGSFGSTEELKARLLRFIDYFNQHLAKPFRWTYAGRPLAA